MNRKTKPNPKLAELIHEFEYQQDRLTPELWEDKSYHKLIDYYSNQGAIDRALDVTEAALTHYKYRTEFYLTKANLLMRQMKLTDASKVLEQAIRLAPYDREVQMLKSKLLAVQGHSEEALMLVEEIKLIFHKTDISDLLIIEAFIRETMKDFEKMFYTLKEALTINPDNAEALEQIWVSVEFSKKYDESIILHLELIDKNPYSYLAWYNLGHAYSCIGEYEKALEAIEYSFIINPQFEQGYHDCAELAVQIGQHEKAYEIYNEVLQNFGSDSEVVAYMSECLIKLKRYKEAKKILNKAYRTDPYNDEICYYLGLCYFESKELNKAIHFLKEAILIEEYREEYHATLADTYVLIGEFSQAETHYAKAARTGLEQSQYWTKYISFLLERKNYEKAYKILVRADKYSVGTDLLFCKVAYNLITGNKEEALIDLKEAITDDPSQLYILTQLVPDVNQDPEVRGIIRYYSNTIS
ncbi:MAG: tetratricopeptide repeat protein [Saprospiraceae bacterium]|nr:tetratricopeptide repeat protein [Saprospiraceae bacterium]